jgi:hypothetical protein
MALRFGIENIPSTPTNGLIMNIDLSNSSSYNGSGLTITDLSGNGNNLTIAGGPTFTGPTVSTPGFFSFPGGEITRYLVRSPFSMPTTTVSLAIWVRQSTARVVPTTGVGIISYEVTGAGNNVLLYDQNDRINGLQFSTTGVDTFSGLSISNNSWSHVVLTTNRTTGDGVVYVNSTRRFSFNAAVGTLITSGGSFMIAQEQDGPGTGGLDPNQAFIGDFSSLKIYNRVVSASEVAIIFNNERTLFGV